MRVNYILFKLFILFICFYLFIYLSSVFNFHFRVVENKISMVVIDSSSKTGKKTPTGLGIEMDSIVTKIITIIMAIMT